MGEDSLLERVTAAAEERRLSHNSLIADPRLLDALYSAPLVGSRPTRLSSAALQTSPARPSVTNKAK